METIEHGEARDIAIDLIEVNPWNPNEMSADEFNMLSENVEDVDFLDPLLVVPIEDGKFRVVDGEHRLEVMRLRDETVVKCIIADPERFPEHVQKFQTVRMNKIKGKLNQRKFNALVSELMQTGEYTYDQLAHEFGFVDEDEFLLLVESARDSLPTDEMKTEFDKTRDEIKTVDDLSLVLNRLFTRFGDTLPSNFMILDFGGKSHLWVRMKHETHKRIMDKARDVMAYGFTFDSVLDHVLTLLPVDKFIERHRDLLEEVPTEQGTDLNIDDVLDE